MIKSHEIKPLFTIEFVRFHSLKEEVKFSSIQFNSQFEKKNSQIFSLFEQIAIHNWQFFFNDGKMYKIKNVWVLMGHWQTKKKRFARFSFFVSIPKKWQLIDPHVRDLWKNEVQSNVQQRCWFAKPNQIGVCDTFATFTFDGVKFYLWSKPQRRLCTSYYCLLLIFSMNHLSNLVESFMVKWKN